MSEGRRRRAYVWGLVAEYIAIALLLCKGYSILERRHRNTGGEIDIVATQGKVLVLIEVKARTNETAALESVTVAKQQRLARAAASFIATHSRYAQHGLRFDVMVVTSLWKIHHHKDAWRAQ